MACKSFIMMPCSFCSVPEDDAEKGGEPKSSQNYKREQLKKDDDYHLPKAADSDIQTAYKFENDFLMYGKGRRISWCTVNTLNVLSLKLEVTNRPRAGHAAMPTPSPHCVRRVGSGTRASRPTPRGSEGGEAT